MTWKKIKEKVVYSGYRTIIKKFFKLSNGSVHDFDIISGKDYVSVLPIDENGNVITIKQFRPGPEDVIAHIPGGNIDDGDSPEEAARKELLEETGYSGNLIFVGKTYKDPYSNRLGYVFIAKKCKKISEQDLSEDEDIQLKIMSLSEFRESLKFGNTVELGAMYMALDYLNKL